MDFHLKSTNFNSNCVSRILIVSTIFAPFVYVDSLHFYYNIIKWNNPFWRTFQNWDISYQKFWILNKWALLLLSIRTGGFFPENLWKAPGNAVEVCRYSPGQDSIVLSFSSIFSYEPWKLDIFTNIILLEVITLNLRKYLRSPLSNI